MWQHSETAEVAKSGYLKQDGNIVQPNWVAWFGICRGQNNGCLPPPPVAYLWKAVTFLLRWFLFMMEQRIISDNQTFFTRKFHHGENPWFLFHKSRIRWLSSYTTPRQLKTVGPRSPVFTKLPLWPVWPILLMVSNMNRRNSCLQEDHDGFHKVTDRLFSSFNGYQTDQTAVLGKVY